MASDTPRSDIGGGASTGPNATTGTGTAAGSGTGAGTSTGPGAASGRNDPDLEVQIAKLREDVAGLSDSLRNIAGSRAGSAKQSAYALRDDLRDRGERYYTQAQDAAHDLEDQISEKVRTEPLKSIAIAAAVGYLYARIFR